LCLSPVGLSTMTKLAPKRLLGLVMGIWVLAAALGNKLAPGGAAAAVESAVTSYKAKLAKELGVSISPRYGSWDPKTLLITGTVDDLSVPAAGEPSPTPSAG